MQNKSLEQVAFEIGSIMSGDSVSISEKLHAVVPVVSGYLGALRCSIMLINPDEMTIEVKASTNPAIVGLKQLLSDVTISTRALLDDEPFHVNTEKRSYFAPLEASKYNSEYSLSLPIKYLDKKLGVINLTDFLKDDGVVEEKERQAVDLIKHLAVHLYAALTKEQMESKVAKLEQANRKLTELDDLKSSLTGFIVHDLKGPISTVMANLDMLGYEALSPEQFEYVGLAMDDIYKLQNMVMDILDVLKLEEGKITVYREEVDIDALVRRELSALESILARKKIRAEVNSISHMCYIDENLIARVITNLVRNALDYSPEGGKIISDVVYDHERKELNVSISDQGRGIPDDLKTRIFEKYYRAENSTRLVKTGTGLGLAFCKLVVNAHGGEIRAEDAASGGAKIIFTLPEKLHTGDA